MSPIAWLTQILRDRKRKITAFSSLLNGTAKRAGRKRTCWWRQSVEQLEVRTMLSAVVIDEPEIAICTHHEDEHDHDHDTTLHGIPLPESDVYQREAVTLVAESAGDSLGDYSTIPFGPDLLPLEETFLLHSLPGAKHTIYLDFDGHVTGSETAWTSEPFVSSAYSFEGDASTFTTNELEAIQQIWSRVAEDFAPFEINVTTEDPGIDALGNTGDGDETWGTRVVITDDTEGHPAIGAGGVAYVGVFGRINAGIYYSPAFVYVTTPTNVHDAISHEVGHNLGLGHDGTSTQIYYSGHGDWGPTMGTSYGRTVSQWSKGEYNDANNQQDDLAIISNATNGFGYRADDYGDTFGTAHAIPVLNEVSQATTGLIEQNTDVDYFSFTTSAGTLEFDVKPVYYNPNLDIKAELFDANYNLMATSDSDSELQASFSEVVSAGTYYLSVTGTGMSDPAGTGYSDYGSLGQYVVTEFEVVPQEITSLTLDHDSLDNVSTDGTVALTGAFDDFDTYTHTVSVDWGDGNVEDVTVDQETHTFTGDHTYTKNGRYNVTVTVTDSNGGMLPVGTTAAFISSLGFHESFDDDLAQHFMQNTFNKWTATAGQYNVDTTDDSSLGTSTVDLRNLLTQEFEVSADITSVGGSDRAYNGFIVFDYLSETDFKYAGFLAGSNRWVIGYYHGGFGDILAETDWDNSSRSIDTYQTYTVNVHARLNYVYLTVNGEELLSHLFPTHVNQGAVGMAAQNAHTQFDNFFVTKKEHFGEGDVPVFQETFNDRIAQNFEFFVEDNNDPSDIGILDDGQLRIDTSYWSVLGTSTIDFPGFLPTNFEMAADITSVTSAGNWHDGFLVFDYVDETDFKYAGFFTGHNQWVIGHYEGHWGNRLAEVDWEDDEGRTINANQAYRVQLNFTGNMVEMTVDGEVITSATFTGQPNLNQGRMGMAANNAVTKFDNFVVAEEILHNREYIAVNENFEDSVANNFTPNNAALWTVEQKNNNSVYQADSTNGQGLATSIIDLYPEVPSEFEVTAELTSIGGANRQYNGFIMFDYISETDFKYAGYIAGSNKWVIGHYHGGFGDIRAVVDWNDSAKSINTNQTYHLVVTISDNYVSLRVNAEYIVSADFGTGVSLNNGPVGLMTNNAKTQFDNIKVRPIPSGPF